MTSVFFDKKVWGDDVHAFRPGRFIDKAGNLKNYPEFLPFGSGGRHCIGQAAAKMELFLFLSGALQRYEFLPESEALRPTMKQALKALIHPPFYRCVVREREV